VKVVYHPDVEIDLGDFNNIHTDPYSSWYMW